MPKKKSIKTKTIQPLIDQRTEKNLIVESSNSLQNSASSLLARPATKIFIGLLLLFGLLYYFKGLLVAAVVNGQPISRLSILKEAEKQTGGQTLNSLITKTLILQEAKKQKVFASQKDVDAEVKKLEESVSKEGQTLDALLQSQGMTRDELREQIKLQKIIEKMIAKDIKVTDKEIDDFIAQNKNSLAESESSKESREAVKQQLTQTKMSEKFRVFLEDLQKKAKIYYFVNY